MITLPSLVLNTTYNQQKTKTDYREEDVLNNEGALHGYNGLTECLCA